MLLHWLLPLAVLLGGLPNAEPAVKLALVKRQADSLTIHFNASAPARENGLPFIRNYHPREFASLTSFADNWCILQDKRGVMFIGNSGGILLYNGVSWQYVETPAKSIVRSLAMDASGRIYAGASDDLGYLAPGKNGKPGFVSLLSHLPSQYHQFGDIRKTLATPEGIYFLTDKYLFRWKGNRFQQWKAQAPASFISFLGWVNGKLYVQQAKNGLYTLENEQLTLVSNQPPFTIANLSVMLPFDTKSLLIGTRSQGLFLFDGKQCFPYANEANEFLITNNLYHGIRLPDGNLALATLRGGVLLMDQQGRIQRVG